MDIITGHVNTDMDCLASTLLVRKLYPEAVMVFPGTLNKNVRDFVSLHKDALPIGRCSDIKLEEVKRLIVVDTRSPGRLGPLQELLKRTDIEIVVFDHHVGKNSDIRGHHEYIDVVGATTTLVIEQIVHRGLSLTPFEATVAALGMYEDTGRFTFANTTVRDAQILPLLLSAGAQLQVVSEFIGWSISEEQRHLLADLLTKAEIIEEKGLRYIIGRAERSEYIEDLALVTHRMGELYDVDTAVTVVAMGNHVYFVGRSYSGEIDVERIARALGGGGHPRAASAIMKNEKLENVYQKVSRMLTLDDNLQRTARDIMSFPVKTIAPALTMKEAGQVLVRCGHSGIPVVDGQQIVGIISRRDIEKAQRKRLGHAPVKGFMQRNVVSVAPDTTIRDLQRLMIEHDIGRLPVVEGDRLIGIISRSDVLRLLHGTEVTHSYRVLYRQTDPMTLPVTEQIMERLKRREHIYHLLAESGKLAAEMGMRAAVVGGFVRDLLLGVANEDIDIAVEGDGMIFAEELGRCLHAKLKIHEIFGTAMLILPDGKKIDIATARTEYYEFPAALPTVSFSSLRQDLGRRDFTINAMAVDITPDHFGHVLDFFGGYADLRQGFIRILYSQSFYDDPTRMFRAIRFEQRYGFKLEMQTEQLLRICISKGIWQKLSPERVARELMLIFKENRCRRIIKRLEDTGLWSGLFPEVRLDHVMWEGLRRSQQVRYIVSHYTTTESPWLVVPMLLFHRLTVEQQVEYIEVLKLTSHQRENVLHTLRALDNTLARLQQRHLTGAEIYELLHPLSVEGIIFVATLSCRQKTANRRILAYLTELRRIKPKLDGEDIKRLGVKPGPVIGEILGLLHREKLNGGLPTKDDEMQYVEEVLSKRKEWPFSV